MPELPEVETVRRGLNQLTSGQIIRGGEVLLNRSLAYPLSVSDFWENLRDVSFERWQRRGKYLLAELSKPQGKPAGWLGVHLRMTGQLLWLNRDEPLQPHTRIRLFCGETQELRFVDIRTFGKVWWVPPTQTVETIMTGLKNLGTEPLEAGFSNDYLREKFKTRQGQIKSLLLNQEIVAGIGNIYADEALFKSGIHPTTIASQLTLGQIDRLRSAIIEVLQKGIEEGGTTLRDFRSVTGINGNYGSMAWVYGRTNQPCRVCQTPIERLKLGGRSAHFCPQCQR